MSQEPRIPDVYGPGSHTDAAFVPVTKDTERIFRLIAAQTPGFTQDEKILSKVKFVGEDFELSAVDLKEDYLGECNRNKCKPVPGNGAGCCDADRDESGSTTEKLVYR